MRPRDYQPIPNDQEEEEEGEIIKETEVAESSSHLARTKITDGRPPTYYGEGPFDPPSSEDESLLDAKEEESRPLSPGRAEYGETGSRRSNAANNNKVRMCVCKGVDTVSNPLFSLRNQPHSAHSYIRSSRSYP
jgi:hypothetical protein